MHKILLIFSAFSILCYALLNAGENGEKLILRNLIINDKIKKHEFHIAAELLLQEEIMRLLNETGYFDNRASFNIEVFADGLRRARFFPPDSSMRLRRIPDGTVYSHSEGTVYFEILYMEGIYGETFDRRVLKLDFSKDIEESGFMEMIEVNRIGETEGGFSLLETVIAVFLTVLLLSLVSRVYTSTVKFSSAQMKSVHAEDEIQAFCRFFSENIESMSGIESISVKDYFGDASHMKGKLEIESAVFCNRYFEESIRMENLFIMETEEREIDGEFRKRIKSAKSRRSLDSVNSEALSFKAKRVFLEPVPEDMSFRDAPGIRLSIEFSEKGAGSFEISETAFYGNR